MRWIGVLILLLVTILNIDWMKHPTILSAKEQITLNYLNNHIHKHLYSIKGDTVYRYMQFRMGIDTITIRFTRNSIVTLSNYEYSSQKYGWTLGYISFKGSQDNWIQLHDKFGEDDNFIVPLIANRKSMNNLEEQLYRKILPAWLREDNKGNMTQIIKQWN